MTAVLPSIPSDEATLSQARADQTRAAAVSLVQALYRLVKASQIHAETNDAVASLVRFTQEAVSEYCQRSQVQVVTLHFTKDTVFINGQMLRAARQSYQCAAELATMLDKGGVSELTIPMAVGGADISAFARAVVECSRDQANPRRLAEARCGTVRLRNVKLESIDSDAARQESPKERIVKTYASAVVVMRELHEQLGRGDLRLPHRLKRIAQRLISHADEDVRTLVSLAGGKVAEADDGTRAVNTAIIAIAMARQVTRERPLLTGLAMAALLMDAGRIRLEEASKLPGAITALKRTLNEDELDRTPASSVVMLTALGRIHPPSLTRVAIAYEALALERADRIGPPYQGKRPESVLGRILHVARRFVQLISPPPHDPSVSLEEAIRQLETATNDASGRVEVRLLLGALGFFPPGTLVELNTGEMAVVLSVPALAVDHARPPVRILYDARMRMIEPARDIDLAAPVRDGEPLRCLRKIVDADPRQMQQMRAYVESLAKRSRVESSATPPHEEEADPTIVDARLATEDLRNMPTSRPSARTDEQESKPASSAGSDRLAAMLAAYLDEES